VNSFFPESVKYVKYRKTADTGGTAMRKIGILGLIGVLALFLAGCGGGSSGPDIFVSDILSLDGADDGDIGRDVAGVYSVFTSADPPNTVIVSDNPADNRRGFVSFSITSIPSGAAIRSATIFLPIFRATPEIGSLSVSLFVDMVSFPSLDTLVTQGSLDAIYNGTVLLQGPTLSVFPGEANTDKSFDARDAFLEARRLGFSTLQIRLEAAFGDVEIDDLLLVDGTGTPLLRVEYF
jgi:hypothetical protein